MNIFRQPGKSVTNAYMAAWLLQNQPERREFQGSEHPNIVIFDDPYTNRVPTEREEQFRRDHPLYAADLSVPGPGRPLTLRDQQQIEMRQRNQPKAWRSPFGPQR